MTVHASFDAQTSYGPSDLMQRDADWIAPGVVTSSDLQVTAQSPAAMAVNVAGSAANTPGGNAWLTGGYRLNNDAQLALTVTSADATNPRIDIVVAGVNTSTNPYTPEVKIVTGTAAASPVAPATPTGYLLLANVAVAAGATSIAQANITDKRVVASLQGNASALTGIVTTSELGAPNGAASLDANGHVPAGQLANAVLTSEVGAANGVAPLDGTGKVPTANIPALSYVPTSAEGVANGVATTDANNHVIQTANNSLEWNGANRTSAASAPSSPNPGDEWYNTSTNRKLYWNGTSWVDPLKYQ